MAFAISAIPFDPITKSFHPEELNRFCLNKKIMAKRVEFFKDGEEAYWSVFLEYETVLEEPGRETSAFFHHEGHEEHEELGVEICQTTSCPSCPSW